MEEKARITVAHHMALLSPCIGGFPCWYWHGREDRLWDGVLRPRAKPHFRTACRNLAAILLSISDVRLEKQVEFRGIFPGVADDLAPCRLKLSFGTG